MQKHFLTSEKSFSLEANVAPAVAIYLTQSIPVYLSSEVYRVCDKKKKSGSNLIFVMLLISKASQICTVEIGFVSDKRANRSKQVFQNLCLLKEMEMRKAWKQPNEWSSAVHTELCVSSWVASLQTNTLSALYVLYKSSLSSNTRALYKKYPCVCWGMWLMWLPVALEALH